MTDNNHTEGNPAESNARDAAKDPKTGDKPQFERTSAEKSETQKPDTSNDIASKIDTNDDKNMPVDEIKRENEHPALTRPEPTRYGDWEKNGRCIDF